MSSATGPAVFLTAEWRYLVMLNYEIEPAMLRHVRPPGVELDDWQGQTVVSTVGFLFRGTRLRGLAIPFHQHFEEVNLRLYVRRRVADGWRRGVVFIKEIVPRRAIATVARLVYNERYVALPMRHRLSLDGARGLGVRYEWRHAGRWERLWATAQGEPQPITAGSEEEFITEHYWGYAAQRGGGCVEYGVEHPRWRVWPAATYGFECDVAHLYGPAFVDALTGPPRSAFIAEGSAVAVRRGARLRPAAG
jgi:hypothetical protein